MQQDIVDMQSSLFEVMHLEHVLCVLFIFDRNSCFSTSCHNGLAWRLGCTVLIQSDFTIYQQSHMGGRRMGGQHKGEEEGWEDNTKGGGGKDNIRKTIASA